MSNTAAAVSKVVLDRLMYLAVSRLDISTRVNRLLRIVGQLFPDCLVPKSQDIGLSKFL